MGKIDELKKTNIKIKKLLKNLNNKTVDDYNYNFTTNKIIFNHSLQKGKTYTKYSKNFTRIICVNGKINIFIEIFNENIEILPINTILIPPNTVYHINAIYDSNIQEIRLLNNNTNNLQRDTIYIREKTIENE